jgi:histidinol-phosphate aminotransferase
VRILVEHRANRPWTVLRTFSKAYGLAGMRVGYAVAGSEDVMAGYDRVRTAFNLSAVAQAAAHAAYLDQDYCRDLVEKVSSERDRLAQGLKDLGRDPLPSVANFIAVAMPGPGGIMVEALKARGILIQGIRTPTPGFENFIRITLGLPDDNDACLAAIATELQDGKLYPTAA